jgi:hypothetical protein
VLQAERVSPVVARLREVKLAPRRLRHLGARVLDLLPVEHAGADRVRRDDLVVGHFVVAVLCPARELVEPVLPAAHVPDDAHRPARVGQRRSNRDVGVFLHARGFVDDRGVDVFAVERVRLVARLEPDHRAVEERDRLVGQVRGVEFGRHRAHRAAERDARLIGDRRDPPIVLPRLPLERLLDEPSNAARRLPRLRARLDERVTLRLEDRRELLRVEVRPLVFDVAGARRDPNGVSISISDRVMQHRARSSPFPVPRSA